MTSRDIRDVEQHKKGSSGPVLCELLGGGPQDGARVRMDRRYDFITYTEDVLVAGQEGSQKRIFESLYDYHGTYRLLSSDVRVYRYRFAGVQVYESEEVRLLLQQCNDDAGLSGPDGIQPEDLSGIHGADECLSDEPEGV